MKVVSIQLELLAFTACDSPKCSRVFYLRPTIPRSSLPSLLPSCGIAVTLQILQIAVISSHFPSPLLFMITLYLPQLQ